MTSDKRPSPVIRASEIGEYVYCERTWWLRRVRGVRSTNTAVLRSGRQARDRHGRAASGTLRQRRLARLLIR